MPLAILNGVTNPVRRILPETQPRNAAHVKQCPDKDSDKKPQSYCKISGETNASIILNDKYIDTNDK